MTRIAVALVVLAAAAWMQPVAGPELAIVNARVFTGDASRPWAEAVAVKANRIVVVGTTAEARAAASATTRVIDAGGRLLIPGINDAHVHPGATPPATSLEGPPAMEHDPTLDEVLKRLEAAVAKAPSGGWIEGEIGGAVLADPAATRATLDRVSAGHPVYLHAWTGHGVIVNTAALRALKIRDDEPDPPGGRFARADDGRTISGLAEEYACYLVTRRLSLLTDSAERARGFAGFASEAASLGITSAQAMATSFPLDATLEALRGGDLPLRLRLIDFPFTPMSQWTAAPALPAASPLVSVSGTKWILDGTPLERLMFVRQPYSDQPSVRGRANFTGGDLRAFLTRALAARQQPMFHAAGDAAIAAVLDALEASGGDRWKPLRPRIEHGDMLDAAEFARAIRMGVTLVQNPSHFMIPPVMQARLGLDRSRRLQQVKDAIAAGVPFALGSDGPLNPYLNMMFAALHPTNPSQALSVEQSLVAYTAGSAAAEFAESEKGMLKPGMLADMALLSQDILTVPPPELPKTVSVLTIVDGRIVHDRLAK